VKDSEQIKDQLITHFKGGEAFVPLEELLKLIPFDVLGKRPDNLPYSFYEIFYHIWFTQKDILDYCYNDNYTQPQWPKDYWPADSSPENKHSWENLKQRYFEDRDKFSAHFQNPKLDLTAAFRREKSHNMLREILLIMEHTAYHTGQLVVILRSIGIYNNNQG